MEPSTCLICERVALWREGRNPYFIEEFAHSIFVVGDHQFHKGYALVLLKKHVPELLDLPSDIQSEMFKEVLRAGQALVGAFHPWKMNYSCYGNAEPHVHWHLFPRYESDPDRRRNPWLHSPEFKDHRIDEVTAKALCARIRQQLDD
jgi:diadenosine tetraphosphate (Ap4A) HIT family hydrolase